MNTLPGFFNTKLNSLIADVIFRNSKNLAQVFIREAIFLSGNKLLIGWERTFGFCDGFFFLNKLKKLKARLGVDDGTKSAVQLKNESKLRSWLENKTLLQILQWFDAVYAMQVETPYGKRTITTETTARDELFLRELGITLVR